MIEVPEAPAMFVTERADDAPAPSVDNVVESSPEPKAGVPVQSAFDQLISRDSTVPAASSLPRLHNPAAVGNALLWLMVWLLVGALIEARSCERFGALAPLLPAKVGRFYRGLLGGDRRDVALMKAKADLMKSEEFSHPFYWAAFQLHGSRE